MTEANAKCAFERQRDDRYQVVFLGCLGQVMRIILAGQPLIEIKRTYAKSQIVISCWGRLLRSLRDTPIRPDTSVNLSVTTGTRHSLGGSASIGDHTAHLLLASQEIHEPDDLAGSRI